MTRVNVREILANPTKRRDLFVACLMAIQAREGIETTREQAEAAYDLVQALKRRKEKGLPLP